MIQDLIGIFVSVSIAIKLIWDYKEVIMWFIDNWEPPKDE